jgi:hypothetical protein|tara:strand:- start:321 stop:599 length:279 start_codon:yes stop_codon:yes gene_type:complete
MGICCSDASDAEQSSLLNTDFVDPRSPEQSHVTRTPLISQQRPKIGANRGAASAFQRVGNGNSNLSDSNGDKLGMYGSLPKNTKLKGGHRIS